MTRALFPFHELLLPVFTAELTTSDSPPLSHIPPPWFAPPFQGTLPQARVIFRLVSSNWVCGKELVSQRRRESRDQRGGWQTREIIANSQTWGRGEPMQNAGAKSQTSRKKPGFLGAYPSVTFFIQQSLKTGDICHLFHPI